MSAAVVITPPAFKPFSDDQLAEFDSRFSMIEVYTPEPRRSKWAKPLPPGQQPDPPFSLVFRPATPDEWTLIQRQINDDRRKSGAPKNLAMATIVAVSIDGQHIIHSGDANTPPNDSQASKGPRDALARILATPGYVGLAEDVSTMLGRLNGVNADAVEKG